MNVEVSIQSVKQMITFRSEEERSEAKETARRAGLPLSTLIQQLLREKKKQLDREDQRPER